MRLTLPRFLCLTAAAALFLTSCNKPGSTADKPKKVAFVTNGVASFWTICAEGVKAAGKDLGIDAQTLMPAEGISDQKRIIEDLLTRGINGMAISAIDPVNQKELINNAARATKVITADSDAPGTDRLCYIGMDNYKAGRMCGDLVREAMPNGGSVMLLIGRLEQDNAKRRRQGVIDAILGRSEDPSRFDPPSEIVEGNGFKVLGTLTDQFDRAKAKANAEDSIAKYPDLGCMVGLLAYNPPLILEAIAQANKTGKIKVVAFDEDDATLAGIEKGTVHGTVVQDPFTYGYRSIALLKSILEGNTSEIPANKFIDIPARQIRKDNVAEFSADLKKKLAGSK